MSMQKVYEIHSRTPYGRMIECFRPISGHEFLSFFMDGISAGHFRSFFIKTIDEFNQAEEKNAKTFCEILMKHYELEKPAEETGTIYDVIGTPENFNPKFVLAIEMYLQGEK